MRILPVVAAAVVLAACGPSATEKKAATAAPAPEKVKPPDESRRFPKSGLSGTEVITEGIWGKAFMPGGTVAQYRKRGTEYEMFVARLANPTDAAIRLLDWKRAMTDAKLVPSFGGYFGTDAGTPVFVFSKGDWLAGVRGLNEKEADVQARVLAAQLN